MLDITTTKNKELGLWEITATLDLPPITVTRLKKDKNDIQYELDQELKINFHQGQVFTKVNLEDSKVMLQGSAEYRKQDVLLNL